MLGQTAQCSFDLVFCCVRGWAQCFKYSNWTLRHWATLTASTGYFYWETQSYQDVQSGFPLPPWPKLALSVPFSCLSILSSCDSSSVPPSLSTQQSLRQYCLPCSCDPILSEVSPMTSFPFLVSSKEINKQVITKNYRHLRNGSVGKTPSMFKLESLSSNPQHPWNKSRWSSKCLETRNYGRWR